MKKLNNILKLPENKSYSFPDKNSNGKNVNKKKLLTTDEGLYSITYAFHANITTNLIKKHIYWNKNKPQDITITDMTSNVGGDLITFALNFKNVNGIEIDDNNFKALKNNVKVYNLKNVKLYKGDSTKIIKTLEQDVIFMDPPWGGASYKNKYVIDYLKLGKHSIEYWINYINKHKLAKLVALKLPNNYNFERFEDKVNSEKIFIYAIKKSFTLIIVKF